MSDTNKILCMLLAFVSAECAVIAPSVVSAPTTQKTELDEPLIAQLHKCIAYVRSEKVGPYDKVIVARQTLLMIVVEIREQRRSGYLTKDRYASVLKTARAANDTLDRADRCAVSNDDPGAVKNIETAYAQFADVLREGGINPSVMPNMRSK